MTVEFETREHVAIITLNRPEARNAINGEMAAGIESAIDRIESDSSLWCAIITARGSVFSAGADLKEISAGRANVISSPTGGFAGITTKRRTKPLIAAVNGPALAGGCEIVLACDLCVASDQAVFGLPETKRSLVAAGGGLFRLPRAIGMAVATEVMLTAEPISAQRCLQLGMINSVVPEDKVLDAALDLAARIVKNAPLAVFASLGVIKGAFDKSEQELWSDSMRAFQTILKSEDFREGPRAFIEKRAPAWKGK